MKIKILMIAALLFAFSAPLFSQSQKVKPITPEEIKSMIQKNKGQGKAMFIYVWASWCGFCREEMPEVEAAYKKYKDRGVDFMLLSVDKAGSLGSLNQFIAESEIKAPVYWLNRQDQGTWVEQYQRKSTPIEEVLQIDFNGVPRSLIYNATGKVVVEQKGIFREDELDSEVAAVAKKKVEKQTAKLQTPKPKVKKD
jgi:thiol-disulfide isomerase/thioredoxin